MDHGSVVVYLGCSGHRYIPRRGLPNRDRAEYRPSLRHYSNISLANYIAVPFLARGTPKSGERVRGTSGLF